MKPVIHFILTYGIWIALAALAIFYLLLRTIRKSSGDLDKKELSDALDKEWEEGNARGRIVNILDGNVTAISEGEKFQIMEHYVAWQEKYRKLFENAARSDLSRRRKYIKRGNIRIFNVTYSDNPPEKNSSPFTINAFTETFPSLNDMDDWAMTVAVNDILTLNGISIGDPKKYYLHKKKHFVNHNMVQAIILFDLYVLK